MTKKSIAFVTVLLLMSCFMLFMGFSYSSLETNLSQVIYSDKSEYLDTQKGINYINTLPMNINIINKYFSNINNLSDEEKEEILLAYVVKNNYKLYDCGSSTNKNVFCINKSDLNDELNKIGLDSFNFVNNIKTYIDGLGKINFISSDEVNYYKFSYTKNNYDNKSYIEFYKYKKDNDLYVFYVYQGFYRANCSIGEDISLYDYITGDVVYQGVCNGNHGFNTSNIDYSNLQLYKYELKKNDNGDFYLYGYNPVRS